MYHMCSTCALMCDTHVEFVGLRYITHVKTISMMGVNGLYSVLGANYRVLCTKYGMNLNNIVKVWNERCANEKDIIRKCEQVRELCEVRDSCVTSILNKEENYTIIELLFTY